MSVTRALQSFHRLGILGGGQLGRMFIQEAISYDIHVHIMENDLNAPSANIATTFKKRKQTDSSKRRSRKLPF